MECGTVWRTMRTTKGLPPTETTLQNKMDMAFSNATLDTISFGSTSRLSVTMRAWPVARSIFDAPYVREANEGTTSWIRLSVT